MSAACTELEKTVEEVLKKFMADKYMSYGVHASSTRELQASPSTGHHSKCTNTVIEKHSKHRDDLVNAKHISLILLDYIPPLAGTINCYWHRGRNRFQI
jgi:hypothetical protein